MATPSVIGTQVSIGFAGATYSGTIREDSSHQPTGDIEFIRNEDNQEATAIISNLGKRITVSFICGAELPTPKVGDTVTLDGVAMLCESADIRHSRTATRGTITGYKPDGLTLGGGAS